MRNRNFVPFERKQDNISPITAYNNNKMADLLEELSTNNYKTADKMFLLKLVNALYHSEDQNSMFVSVCNKDPVHVDEFWEYVSPDLTWDEKEGGIRFIPGSSALEGELFSNQFSTEDGDDLGFLSVILDQTTCPNSSISVYYMNENETDWVLIDENLIVEPPVAGNSYVIRVVLARNDNNLDPRLNGIGVLFEDPFYRNTQMTDFLEWENSIVAGLIDELRDLLLAHIDDNTLGVHDSRVIDSPNRIAFRDDWGLLHVNETPRDLTHTTSKKYVDDIHQVLDDELKTHNHDEIYARTNFRRIHITTNGESAPQNPSHLDIWIDVTVED